MANRDLCVIKYGIDQPCICFYPGRNENMKRKVTAEEREILLQNPELVMFDPFSAMKVHTASLATALIPAVIVAALVFACGFLFPGTMNAHPKLFAGVSCGMIVLACAFIPLLFFFLDDRAFKIAQERHYRDQLRMLLPGELECRVVRVSCAVYEKAEGTYMEDGEEKWFGYVSCRNVFRFEPGDSLAIVSGGNGFSAFIRRDPVTECFYQET